MLGAFERLWLLIESVQSSLNEKQKGDRDEG